MSGMSPTASTPIASGDDEGDPNGPIYASSIAHAPAVNRPIVANAVLTATSVPSMVTFGTAFIGVIRVYLPVSRLKP
jgi:hypothetical protein